MRSRRAIPLSEALNQWISSRGVKGPFAQGRIVAAWEDLLSEQMRRHITSSRVRGDKLHVIVSSTVWRQELHARREDWCRRLNKELGSDVIKDIIFR